MQTLFSGTNIISVSGCASGIGKTLLCEHILSMLPGSAAIKVTTTGSARCVTDADEVILAEGKDTCRLRAQGAGHVIWIQSPQHCLDELLREAEKRLPSGTRTVLIEGNSALACLAPDCAFFVCDARLRAVADLKPSRIHALGLAHAIILNMRGACADLAATIALCRSLNPNARILSVDLGSRPAVVQSIAPIIRERLPQAPAP